VEASTPTTTPTRQFDHLREHSIGLPEALFQSITHMAPGAAVAFSLLASVAWAGQALPLAVLFAAVACSLVAVAIGQLAKQMPSAGGLYTYVSNSLGPHAGFLTGWSFMFFAPLVAPLLFLIFAWATEDVVKNEIGWDIGWAWWVIVAALIVFVLTYRDVRISTRAGIVLGAIEIVIFLGLSIWMLVSNFDQLNMQAFNPNNVNPAASSDFSGVFKGMVFGILAFIGFEAAAPLGEEARRPRWTIPRAVIGAAVLIGAFYVICSYAWVYGAGFDNFLTQTSENPDPWRALGKVFWHTGWILVFFAILNSAIANANAGVNAATRVVYAMARNGAAPHQLAHTHPEHKTPGLAIILNVWVGAALALLLGWKWDPLTAFSLIATAITIVVIVIYILLCIGTIRYYLGPRRSEFNVLLHIVCPVLGALAFMAPLYYTYKDRSPYPVGYANWIAIAWLGIGILLTIWMGMRRPQALENAKRIFVDDETVAAPAPTPAGQ